MRANDGPVVEAKGIASPVRAAGLAEEAQRMGFDSDRLVQRVLQQLEKGPSKGAAVGLSAHDLSELETRIRRLRGVSNVFSHVTLSRHIVASNAANKAGRVGGELVTTEV